MAFSINSSPICLSRISITDTREIETLLYEVDTSTFTTQTPSDQTSSQSPIGHHIKLSINVVLGTIPLSNGTVQRRIDEMGDDVESQLVQILSKTDHAFQIDESTVRDNEALLIATYGLCIKRRQKKKCCSLFHCHQTQKPYRYLRLSRIYTKLKGYQCRTLYSSPPTELPPWLEGIEDSLPHETRDSCCHSDPLFDPQTPSRG